MLTSLSTTIGAAAAQLPADVVHGPGDGFVFWPFFLLIPLFWFLVIGFFIFFGRRMWRRNHYWAATQGAESVLRERYARGEIDETEYRQRLEVLRTHPTK
ncbi:MULTISPECIES: SHOCT domain-containing protein [unclassified Arthrobacter]|uniref:SHOCT domain-containing protein n=1 Tax=unclassified Arthrobacter TaxID=235627 RepID=UPI001F20C345|nr:MULTISPECIES: SHOCT domain-containing protein [unclassified Arthrobacter]MCX2747578.1 SHOCT domain-containing protein [Arthrobacter sp. MI7-26]UKA59887.1 SHOCT domain-containing protein [Arthrobacter sp. FW306-2-2C-D06B]